MKALYIVNGYSAQELALIERAKQEMGNYIEVVELSTLQEPLKKLVRSTPALIIVNDDLQGENLISEGVDGKLLATAMLYKRMEEEDLAIHQQETHRLDNLINIEKTKAIDDYTAELLEGGLL
jgi:hypothetical protein